MGLAKSQEKEYAKILFVSERLSQKEIAERTGVSEKTISKWVNEGEWETLRKSLLVTKQQQLSFLYNQLDFINTQIADRALKVADSREVDVISKLTAAIDKLETETNIAEYVDTGRKFIDFVRSTDLDMAKKITNLFDAFIHSNLR